MVEGGIDSGLEIRRILLLTRLRAAPKGMTMPQLVKNCERVPGWNVIGHASSEVVRLVLQTLIDDKLVAARRRFILTSKGRDYLDDPLKWRIDKETTEEIERKLFWDSIYKIFEGAYRRLRPKVESTAEKDPVPAD